MSDEHEIGEGIGTAAQQRPSLVEGLTSFKRKHTATCSENDGRPEKRTVSGRTGFDESVTAVQEAFASTEMDTHWLFANTHILLNNSMNIPTMQIVDCMVTSSQGQFLHPNDDYYQLISIEETARKRLQVLLNLLTPTTAVNNVPLFRQALGDVCPHVLKNCIQVQGALESMQIDLNNYYKHERDKEKPFTWLDDQAETANGYILNTCLIEKTEAEKLVSDDIASTAREQHRRDYIYARPAKEKLICLHYLFQSTNADSQPLETVPTEGMPIVPSTGTENWPVRLPQSGSSAVMADQNSSFRLKLGRAKRVGIYAGAGCGKTCCCINVTTSYPQLWPTISLVVFWRLREPNVQKAESMEELLLALGPSWTPIRAKRLAAALLGTAGQGVLAVIDGVDELDADKNAYIWQVLRGNVLPEARLLVTSRPCALAKIVFDEYDTNLELLGFTEEQISQFIHQCLGDNLAPKLGQFLDENERLASLMYVPLIALFICEVFRLTPESPPSTRTALYCKLLALFARRSKERQLPKTHCDGELNDVMSTLDVCEFDGTTKTHLHQLSLLAELAQQNDKIIFGHKLVKAANCSHQALELGVVSRKSGRVEQQYSFQHLTIQEFLVAFNLRERIRLGQHLPLPSPAAVSTPSAKTCTTAQEQAICNSAMPDDNSMRVHLDDVVSSLISRGRSVVLQFLAGLVSSDLLPVFFHRLNNWLHHNWSVNTYMYVEEDMEADSRQRLLTCLECVKEAFGDQDDGFPSALHLPETVTLWHAKASDLLLLAKAMKATKYVKALRLHFHVAIEQTEDDKCSRVLAQTRRALALLLKAVKTCGYVKQLVVCGPSATEEFFDKGGWKLLCDVVQHTSLEMLVVSWCGLGDAEMMELTSAMENNTTLKQLSLAWNQIGDGVRILADVLEANATLDKLYLEYNNYGDATRLRFHQLQHITSLDA